VTNQLLFDGAGHLMFSGGQLVFSDGTCSDCCAPTFLYPPDYTNYGCTLCDDYDSTPPAMIVGGKTATIVVAGVVPLAGTGFPDCAAMFNHTWMSSGAWTIPGSGTPTLDIGSPYGTQCFINGFGGYLINPMGTIGLKCNSIVNCELSAVSGGLFITYNKVADLSTVQFYVFIEQGPDCFDPAYLNVAQGSFNFALTHAGQLDCNEVSGLVLPTNGGSCCDTSVDVDFTSSTATLTLS
jgi:hypothetical protein